LLHKADTVAICGKRCCYLGGEALLPAAKFSNEASDKIGFAKLEDFFATIFYWFCYNNL
jgi:hypothetical protein